MRYNHHQSVIRWTVPLMANCSREANLYIVEPVPTSWDNLCYTCTYLLDVKVLTANQDGQFIEGMTVNIYSGFSIDQATNLKWTTFNSERYKINNLITEFFEIRILKLL